MVASSPHVEEHQWFAIVNPVAGNGRGLDEFPRISKLLREQQIHCEAVFSEHKFHAVELTVEAVRRGYRRIIAVGGDGTLHEVVNGLFIQQVVPPSEVLLAVIAVGSGNDWIRMFGIPQNCADAIRAIREEHSFLQDVGVVSYEEAKYRQSRYMVNVAGAGYEAQVVRCFNHLKKKGRRGRWLYTWSVIRSFFRYKPTGTKVWGRRANGSTTTCCSVSRSVWASTTAAVSSNCPTPWPTTACSTSRWCAPFTSGTSSSASTNSSTARSTRSATSCGERGGTIRIESSPEIEVELDGELLGHTPSNSRCCGAPSASWCRREFLESME